MNKTFLFIALFFSMQIILALINPYNFYTIGIKSVIIYLLFIIALLLYSLVYRSPIKRRVNMIFRKSIVLFTNFYLALGVILFLVHLYIKAAYGLSSQQLRDLYFFGQEQGEITIFNYLFLPMSIINGFGFFVFLVLLVSLKDQIVKQNLILFIKCLLALLLINSAESGRMIFFVLGVTIIVFFIKYKRIFKSLKNNKSFVFVLILSFILVGYVTFTRLKEFSFFMFLYTYFIGPVFLFDYSLNDQAGIIYNPDNRFGFSFMSLDWIVAGIYNMFSSERLNSLFTISDRFLVYGYEVNSQIAVNAFFTFFTFFFIDYGYLAPIFIIVYHFVLVGIGRVFKTNNNVELDIFLSFFLLYGGLLNMLNAPMYLVTLVSLYTVNPYKKTL